MSAYILTEKDVERCHFYAGVACRRLRVSRILDEVRAETVAHVFQNTRGRPASRYISACAYYGAIDVLRVERRQEGCTAELLFISPDCFEVDFEELERHRVFLAALRALSEDERAMVLAERGDHRAIARRLGVAPSTVMRRAERAVDRMAQICTQNLGVRNECSSGGAL